MKIIRIVALLGLEFLSCLSDVVTGGQSASCSTYLLFPGKDLACPRTSEPVCGTDGVTYPNECLLCREIWRCKKVDKKHDGKCIQASCSTYFLSSGKDLACPSTLEPVCGTDGVTYPNECLLCREIWRRKAVDKKHDGKCIQASCSTYFLSSGKDLACPSTLEPVCGTDGVTYPNECLLCREIWRRKAVDKKHDGKCIQASCSTYFLSSGKDLACPSTLEPVCGTDGVTYPNECLLCREIWRRKAVDKKHDGKCIQASCSTYFLSSGKDLACPSTLEPVCGTDGVTYPNECLLCREIWRRKKVDKKHDGKCIQASCSTYFLSSGKDLACPSTLEPVCGTDGVTYPNECLLCREIWRRKAVDKKHDGKCIQASCSTYFLSSGKDLACPSTLEPVCGTDGVTYPNECLLCREIWRRKAVDKKHDGKCIQASCSTYFLSSGKDLACPSTLEPVCGTDGVTYPNECLLCREIWRRKAVDKKHDGKCVQASCSTYFLSSGKDLACPSTLEPVCGTDGVTYPNECLLCREIWRRKAVDKKHDGKCIQINCAGYLRATNGDDNICTLEYNPVCATNGITYGNQCEFCTAVANGADIELLRHGDCSQVDCSYHLRAKGICTIKYEPVCGSDGKTYENRCRFCYSVQRSSKLLFLKHAGECRALA